MASNTNSAIWQPDFRNKRTCYVVAGLKGIICTCDGEEMLCITESFRLLNKYADQLYGPVCSTVYSRDELNAEIAVLKTETEKPADSCRFRVIGYGVPNRLFIRTTVPDPVRLVHHILTSEKTCDQQGTRSLRRMIPVEVTCKAFMKDIEAAAAELFDKYFTKEEGKTFCIVNHHLHNSYMRRVEIRDLLNDIIKSRHPENRVDLKHPQLTVLVDVVRRVCCLSVVPDYMELQNYNIMRLCSGEKNDEVLLRDELPCEVDKSVTADASSKDDSRVPVTLDMSETGNDPSKDDSRVAVDVDISETGDDPSKDDSWIAVDVDISETGDDPSKDDSRVVVDVDISETGDDPMGFQ